MAEGYANFPQLCQVMVATRRVCLGRSSYGCYSKLWQSLRPPNGSGPDISQPILMLFKYLAPFPMPSGHLPRAVHLTNAQTRGGIGTLRYIFACSCHPMCPKSKWHVPPPAYGFAYGSYSQLCQSLYPPKALKPTKSLDREEFGSVSVRFRFSFGSVSFSILKPTEADEHFRRKTEKPTERFSLSVHNTAA